MKKLKVGPYQLTVSNVYPYRYDYGKGKEVLRIEVLEEEHEFSELLILKNCTIDIEYIEDDITKNIYSNYSIDFSCQYNAGRFNIEITRICEEMQRIELIENALNEFILGGI